MKLDEFLETIPEVNHCLVFLEENKNQNDAVIFEAAIERIEVFILLVSRAHDTFVNFTTTEQSLHDILMEVNVIIQDSLDTIGCFLIHYEDRLQSFLQQEVIQKRSVGRPKVIIDKEQVYCLLELGFTWKS